MIRKVAEVGAWLRFIYSMTPVVLTYAYLPLPHNVVDVMTA